jgi:hypothetical protein
MTETHLMRRRSWGWISEMLQHEWFPAGRDVPEDEHDACVARVIRMLEAGAGADELAAFLGDFRGGIATQEDRATDRRVAQMLADQLYI